MADNILLAIFYNGASCSPDELPGETDTTAYYATPSAAKIAGAALLERHLSAEGYWVRRVNAGRYRTVATFVVTTQERIDRARRATASR